MTLVFNRQPLKSRRRNLRNHMTKAEVYFWNLVRFHDLEGVKFRRQFSVKNFILDFYVPSLKLAVEIDGGYHLDPEVMEYDAWRQAEIEAYGITFLRFTNDEAISDQSGVLRRLRAAIASLSLRMASPP